MTDILETFRAAVSLIQRGEVNDGTRLLESLQPRLVGSRVLRGSRVEVMRVLANVWHDSGDLERAQELREDALHILEPDGGDDLPEPLKRGARALILLDQGRGYDALHNESAAVAAWEAACNLASAAPECHDTVLGPALLNGAYAAFLVGQLPLAHERNSRAAEVAKRNSDLDLMRKARKNRELFERRLEVPNSEESSNVKVTEGISRDDDLISVANQYRQLMATSKYHEAHELLEKSYALATDARRPDLRIEFFANLGRLRFLHGFPLPLVRAASELAIGALESLRDSSTSYGIDTRHVASLAEESYQLSILCLLDEGDFDAAFEKVERSRTRWLAKEHLGGVEVSDLDLPAQLAVELANERAKLRQVVADSLPRWGKTKPPEIVVAQREYTACVERFFRDFPNLFRRNALAVDSLDHVRAALQSGELLIQPIRTGIRHALLAITNEAVEWHICDLPSSELDGLVTHCLSGLASNLSPIVPLEDDLERLGHALLTQIKALERAHTLLWCSPPTAEPLGRIPFGTLRYEGAYLGQRFTIGHLPSASMVCSLKHGNTTGGILALGNPDGSLPGAELEVAAIAKVFPTRALVRSEATLVRLRGELSHARILHLACHGKYDSDAPGFSVLMLAPNKAAEESVVFVSDLKLDASMTSLVVLSACESGLAGTATSEESGGFVLALIDQGVSSVIGSYWPVEDQATCFLMTRLYAHLATGCARAKALANACADLRQTQPFRHPAAWGAFAIAGDWRGQTHPPTEQSG